MIDFHSHILPGIDDGAKTTDESIEMLCASYNAGVRTIILSPHCYYTRDEDIKAFIRDRNEKYRALKAAVQKSGRKTPEMLLGCELHLNKAHTDSSYLKELAIEGTSYIMLEMPVDKWETEIYDTIYSVTLKGLRPIIAHIDRYFYTHKKDFHNLYSFDLTYQLNCDSFIMRGIKKQVPYFFEAGAVHILGSDMHNLSTRTTHMAECRDIIVSKYGAEYFAFIEKNSKLVLENKPVNIHCFEKMSFVKKLKL